MDYTQHTTSNQREQDRSDQVKNNAGGFVFQVDKWSRLQRFLVLGAEGGTYYVGERKLVRENAQCVSECIAEDPRKLVDTLVEFSLAGRAPSQDETFFALAMTLLGTKGADRRYASMAIPQICRTGSHILQLSSTFTKLSGRRVGSSRALASGFKAWYQDRDVGALCYQTTKYPQRDGWSHGDLIRTTHPSPVKSARDLDKLVDVLAQNDELKKTLMGYMVNKTEVADVQGLAGLEYLDTKLRMHSCTTAKEVVAILKSHNATWEMVPTQFLREPEVWETLLHSDKGVPMTALMRNLGRLSSIGLLKPLSSTAKLIATQLSDVERVRKSRMHPYNVLVAQMVYAQGRGDRGSLTWSPDSQVVEALEATFDASFGNVEPSGKNHLLAIDVSGSMAWPASKLRNGPLYARDAAAAMAVIQTRLEAWCHTVTFSVSGHGWSRAHHAHHYQTGLDDFPVTKRDSVRDVVGRMQGLRAGGTDCALPMQYATERELDVDVFVVYTDSETWAGGEHPYKALQKYRQAMGKPQARLVVVGMVSTDFTIADPSDPFSLDVAGFDSSTPRIISDFAGGRI